MSKHLLLLVTFGIVLALPQAYSYNGTLILEVYNTPCLAPPYINFILPAKIFQLILSYHPATRAYTPGTRGGRTHYTLLRSLVRPC